MRSRLTRQGGRGARARPPFCAPPNRPFWALAARALAARHSTRSSSRARPALEYHTGGIVTHAARAIGCAETAACVRVCERTHFSSNNLARHSRGGPPFRARRQRSFGRRRLIRILTRTSVCAIAFHVSRLSYQQLVCSAAPPSTCRRSLVSLGLCSVLGPTPRRCGEPAQHCRRAAAAAAAAATSAATA